jgi:hypothetical protein
LRTNVHQFQFIYNEFGFIKEIHFYDEQEKLTLNHEGFAIKKIKTNSHGEYFEESFFGTDEKPIATKGNAVKITRVYNDQGDNTEELYKDKYELDTLVDGASTTKYKYDYLGRKIETSYFHQKKPAMFRSQYHKKEIKYAGLGSIIESVSYFDSKGLRVILPLVNNIKESVNTKNTKIMKGFEIVKFKSSPQGALIFIDDIFSGVTPTNLIRKHGRYSIRFQKNNFKDKTIDFEVSKEKGNRHFIVLDEVESKSVDELFKLASNGSSDAENELGKYYDKVKD